MKVSKSIVLGLAVMFVSTACSSKQSNFASGKAKTRVIKAEDSAAAKVELENMEGFEERYAKAAEEYLDTSYEDYMADIVSKVEKHLGSDSIEADGFTIDDPSALVNDLAELFASSDNMYETPREYLEDMESTVDTTNYNEVKEYLASEKDTLTEVREVFAEVDFANFTIVGEGSSESSEESLSLVLTCSVSANGGPYASASAVVNATCTTTSSTQQATPTAQAQAQAQPINAQAQAQAQAQAEAKKQADAKKAQAAATAVPVTQVNPQNIAASQTMVQAAQPLAVNGENAVAFASAATDGMNNYMKTNGNDAKAQLMKGNIDQVISLGLTDAIGDLGQLGIFLRTTY